MITKKQFERFREFYTSLRPLVLEKLKEMYEIEYDRPYPSNREIIAVEFSSEDGLFLVTTEEWYTGCNPDRDYYEVKPEYLYDANAMNNFKEEIAKRKRKEAFEKEIKAREDEQKKTDKEMKTMIELAEKYGFEINPKKTET